MAKEYESIEDILNDLNWMYMTIEEYEEAIKSGKLVRRPDVWDDIEFNQYPSHPLNGDNRFVRMGAANAIKNMASDNKVKFTPRSS